MARSVQYDRAAVSGPIPDNTCEPGLSRDVNLLTDAYGGRRILRPNVAARKTGGSACG